MHTLLQERIRLDEQVQLARLTEIKAIEDQVAIKLDQIDC